MCCCHVIRPTLSKARLKLFFPFLEYKRRYGFDIFGVGKLSYYPTSIINGKCELYLKTSLVTVFQLLAEN